MRLTNHDPDYQPYVISANEPTWRAIYDKLCEYEDAEEQGLLVRLPCKVGSTEYRIIPRRLYYVGEKDIVEVEFNLSMLDEFGKTAFLTREEAEAALKGEREDV